MEVSLFLPIQHIFFSFFLQLSLFLLGLDILINNAAIAWKGDAFDATVASTTLGTNYFGLLNVSCTLF